MLNPNPDCKFDCLIQDGPTFSTSVYYPAVYDKSGNNVNRDKNKTFGQIKCWTCNKQWRYEMIDGNIKFEQQNK